MVCCGQLSRIGNCMNSATQLAQLLCTRLCHDLAGPVGAVAAGVELVGDDPSMADQETLQLISASSAAASRKLKFLRIAFGTTAQSSPAALQDLDATLRNFFESIAGQSGAVELTWPPTTVLADLQDRAGPASIQILLNSVLVAIEAAPRARRIAVEIAAGDEGAVDTTVVAAGDAGDPVRKDILDAVTDPDGVLSSARNAQALYWVTMCREFGWAPTISRDGASLAVAARFQPV